MNVEVPQPHITLFKTFSTLSAMYIIYFIGWTFISPLSPSSHIYEEFLRGLTIKFSGKNKYLGQHRLTETQWVESIYRVMDYNMTQQNTDYRGGGNMSQIIWGCLQSQHNTDTNPQRTQTKLQCLHAYIHAQSLVMVSSSFFSFFQPCLWWRGWGLH